MTGPKLNEKNRIAGSSSGTRARAMNVRMSASKVRVVLNLIRDADVKSADNTLVLLQRDSAHDVRKLLASAIANAVNNDSKDADDLYVKACFADEGPTMKRFRPRAKGRAGQILKRSCHITIVVDTLTEKAMASREQSIEAKGATKTSSRSARVAASRDRVQKSVATDAAVDSAPVVDAPVVNEPVAQNPTESGEEN
jgi:large subunit ribosomal protein L22